MTEEKEMNTLIKKARKICHDINQPLTVIMARSELILLKLKDDDPNYKSVTQIHEQAELLSNRIEELRALFRGASGE